LHGLTQRFPVGNRAEVAVGCFNGFQFNLNFAGFMKNDMIERLTMSLIV